MYRCDHEKCIQTLATCFWNKKVSDRTKYKIWYKVCSRNIRQRRAEKSVALSKQMNELPHGAKEACIIYHKSYFIRSESWKNHGTAHREPQTVIITRSLREVLTPLASFPEQQQQLCHLLIKFIILNNKLVHNRFETFCPIHLSYFET